MSLPVCIATQASMAEEDPEAYWMGVWANGTPDWHLEEVNPYLKRHISHLAPPPGKHRIFLPLCGKSLDLKW